MVWYLSIVWRATKMRGGTLGCVLCRHAFTTLNNITSRRGTRTSVGTMYWKNKSKSHHYLKSKIFVHQSILFLWDFALSRHSRPLGVDLFKQGYYFPSNNLINSNYIKFFLPKLIQLIATLISKTDRVLSNDL